MAAQGRRRPTIWTGVCQVPATGMRWFWPLLSGSAGLPCGLVCGDDAAVHCLPSPGAGLRRTLLTRLADPAPLQGCLGQRFLARQAVSLHRDAQYEPLTAPAGTIGLCWLRIGIRLIRQTSTRCFVCTAASGRLARYQSPCLQPCALHCSNSVRRRRLHLLSQAPSVLKGVVLAVLTVYGFFWCVAGIAVTP